MTGSFSGFSLGLNDWNVSKERNLKSVNILNGSNKGEKPIKRANGNKVFFPIFDQFMFMTAF